MPVLNGNQMPEKGVRFKKPKGKPRKNPLLNANFVRPAAYITSKEKSDWKLAFALRA
jgi:hypothetical protein